MISINKRKKIEQLQKKKQRDQQGLFVAEGAKLALDLLRGGLTLDFVCGLAETLPPFEGQCREVVECSEQELKELSLQKTPSKLIAVFKKPDFGNAAFEPKGLSLVLDEIQDPGNMGTIMRIADWFGIRQIICSTTCADAFNPKTVQASMGAIARVRVEETDLEDFFSRNASEWHLPVYGTFLEGDNIYGAKLEPSGLILMGNEGKGISDKLKHFVSQKLFIPPFPQGETTSESLNVAAATAIVCSEFRRR
ncbi:MAG: RNA methyltransferase [Bacteroidales bacterium]|nr:RNA methyltransferase [Bacteroidales bacterium]